MIKKCKILSYNKFLNILVFDYEGNKIQTTAIIDTECKTVFVKYKNGKYEVVDKSEFDKYVRGTKRKDISEKSDIDEKTEDILG